MFGRARHSALGAATRLGTTVTLVVALLIASHAARGDIEALSDEASVRAANFPFWVIIDNESFSCIAWVRRDLPAPDLRSIVRLPGMFDLLVSDDRVRATLEDTGDILTAEALTEVPLNEWILVGATFDRDTGTLRASCLSSEGQASAEGTDPTFVGRFIGPPVGDLAIGALDGIPAMRGTYGTICIRIGAATPDDLQAIYDARDMLGAYRLDTTGAGGRLTGPTDARYMVNHAMTTNPYAASWEGDPAALAAVVGQPVEATNWHVFYRTSTQVDSDWLNFRKVGIALEARDFVYTTFRDDDFFEVRRPGTHVAWDTPVHAESPRARQLVTGAREPLRMMVSANSRAVKSN
ncbi:MAG: hypothetical protein KDA28_01005, partial [Phycisphaerales bacterium]|nr:hypothetical protein [Phycisphaerales bacterium]